MYLIKSKVQTVVMHWSIRKLMLYFVHRAQFEYLNLKLFYVFTPNLYYEYLVYNVMYMLNSVKYIELELVVMS